jgi:hypothetical protein
VLAAAGTGGPAAGRGDDAEGAPAVAGETAPPTTRCTRPHEWLQKSRALPPEGKGPFPVLIGPHLGGWASSLLRRGYISCGDAGNDGNSDLLWLGERGTTSETTCNIATPAVRFSQMIPEMARPSIPQRGF